MTRTAYLESVLQSLSTDGVLTLVFKPYRGWYLCGEPRWFGDNGEDWLGKNWREAEKELRHLYRLAA